MTDYARLETYLTDYWEYILQRNPTFATYIGDHRFDDALEDLSEQALNEQVSYFQSMLKNLDGLDRTALTAGDTVNFLLLRKTLHNHISLHRFRTHYLALDHLEGPHLDFPHIIEHHPFQTGRDFDNYLSRLRAFPQQVDQVIQLLQTGVQRKFTAFTNVIAHVLEQVETFARLSPEDSPLFMPASRPGDSFPEEEKAEIRNSIRHAIVSFVTPAYQRLSEFLSGEYRSRCRKEPGIWSLPGGDDLYRFLVEYHTTSALSPGEIHDTGVAEVRRIQEEVRRITDKVGFSGSIREFAGHLKEQKDLYPKSRQEILDTYRAILSAMDKRLPEYFGRLPKAAYAVKEIERYREKSAPSAYYYPPPRDFSRPGYYYANTYAPEQRPRYDMEALSYHEAVPGHHLQIAIMQELQGIPDFRRHEGSTAFIEGWALYAERLSKEMGFYRDQYSEYGRLSYELWRAVRLVVDTGLHFFRWDREKAVQYCRQNTGLEDHEIGVEVDRYIALPGQALAYKVGELKILGLRDKAMKELGSHFDIREFHDRLLENGALPLNLLEDIMHRWMAQKLPQ